MKRTLITIYVILLFLSSLAFAEWDFNDEWKTIRELKENLVELDKEKDNIIDDINNIISIDQLKDFFVLNLTINNYSELESIVEKYNENRILLEKKFYWIAKNLKSTDELKNQLIENKKDLYKKLVPYIRLDKKDEYLGYVKSDTLYYNEKKEIDASIIRNQELITNKVSSLEEKIKRHNTFLEERFSNLVEVRLNQKILQISQNQNFIELGSEAKIRVLEKTIYKIKDKISNFDENEQLSLWLTDQKIQIYKIAIKKLEDFQGEIK